MDDHTPGPWYAAVYRDGAFSVHTEPNEDQDHPVICARNSWTHRAAESQANARLIAAAPELLAACQFWVGQCNCDDGVHHIKRFNGRGGTEWDHDEPCPVCAATRAAIARATRGNGDGR